MAFGTLDNDSRAQPMAEINMIPLIDVMLVLLVIFIITAPLLTHAVKIDLPKASSNPNLTKPNNIQLGVKATGELFWAGESVDRDAMKARFRAAANQSPQPELHIRAEASAQYRYVAEVMADAASAGLTRIGFVSDPETALRAP